MWSSAVRHTHNPQLYTGIPHEDFLIRRGGLGYKLSVWDGDARLFITDRVEEKLVGTQASGQGMGVMLQLGPKWLRQYGDVVLDKRFIRNVFAQLVVFGIKQPEKYPAGLNRLDLTLDVLGLSVADFSLDEWCYLWVGYTQQKNFHDSAFSGKLEGLSIGSSSGGVRFKVYDKVAESQQRGTLRFWRSVWGVSEDENINVARFEWSVKAHGGNFTGLRYLSDFTYEGFLDLLNYVTLRWGRLCLPQENDLNPSWWPLAPLWVELRRMIDEWTFNYKNVASRTYEYRPDIKPTYLKSVSSWLAGLMARLGIESGLDSPVSIEKALRFFGDEGLSINDKTLDKWEVFVRLPGSSETLEEDSVR